MDDKQMALDTSIRVNKRVRAMINTIVETRRANGEELRANEAILELVRKLYPDIASMYLEADDSDA